MSGCFLAKYLHFLIFGYRKTLKTGQKTAIPCPGQSAIRALTFRALGGDRKRSTAGRITGFFCRSFRKTCRGTCNASSCYFFG